MMVTGSCSAAGDELAPVLGAGVAAALGAVVGVLPPQAANTVAKMAAKATRTDAGRRVVDRIAFLLSLSLPTMGDWLGSVDRDPRSRSIAE
jgi:hypothetical protein